MKKHACGLLLTGASVRLAARTGHNLFAYISVEPAQSFVAEVLMPVSSELACPEGCGLSLMPGQPHEA